MNGTGIASASRTLFDVAVLYIAAMVASFAYLAFEAHLAWAAPR
jgi:hypothetical protein